MNNPCILIIEDHGITRLGLKVMLNQHYGPNTEFIETDQEATAIETVTLRKIDLCTLDLKLPGVDSVTLIKKMLNIQPELKILVISMSNENLYSQSVLAAGAKGFVSKEGGFDQINSAIMAVKSGRTYLSEQLISNLLSNSKQSQQENPLLKLSKREIQIVQLLLDGHSTKDISGILNLSISTISTFKGRIYEKLAITSLIELYDLARTIPEETSPLKIKS